jgi:2-polyprenyl-3-methyl-5-hydroxy-6-metoxy-1,4-benzoquinol methylase
MDGMAVPGQLEGSLNRAKAQRGHTAAQLSNQFSLTAAGYMSWRRHSLSLLSGAGFTLDQEAGLFRSLCSPQPGQRWLDAGTSGGYYAGLLAAAGAQVLACDLSPAMLKVAQQREHSPLIDWALLDAEDTRLPAASFDGVCIGATLNETGSGRAMLSRPCFRVWGG